MVASYELSRSRCFINKESVLQIFNFKMLQENDEELDIDLSDPDLNKAAVKIQASFRGHLVRKEHDEKQ